MKKRTKKIIAARIKEITTEIKLYIAGSLLFLALLLGTFHVIDIIVTIVEKMSTTWQIILLVISMNHITKVIVNDSK